ncbi:MAG: MOFRL family protein, partial [Candidatus Heimdallarchaeota archaeon]
VKAIQKDEKIALIGTGELTVTIKGNGIGGRNQEMLLSYLNLIRYEDVTFNYCLLAVNLDGIEGNSKAMGALIDNNLTVQINSQNANLEGYLNDNNSNTFFKRFNSEIITGLTGSNVNDLVLVILSKSKLNIKTKK